MGIDTALLIRRTGSIVDSWSRSAIPGEVLAVMSATMIASIGTILETLGTPTPRTLTVVAGGRQILAVQANSEQVLILMAPEAVREAHLRELSQRILSHLSAAAGNRRAKASTRVQSRP